jgi:hypothetical protein
LANVKRVAEAVPEPEPRALPGRKRKPIDYSKFRQAFRDCDAFAAWLAGYPDLSAVICYFYRLEPKIDLARIGAPGNYILKSVNPSEWTPDFCARRFGRGYFLLKINDANMPAGQQERARVWIRVDDPDLPPVYDPRTLLLSDPENADEVQRLLATGVLVRDGEFGSVRVRTEGGPVTTIPGSPAAPAAPGGPATPVPLFDPNMGNQVILKLLERALPSATPQTASEVLKQSFEIADRFQVKNAPHQPDIEEIVERLVVRLRPAAPPGSLTGELEAYERVSALLDKVGAGKALDGAASPSWMTLVAPVLDNFLKPLAPVLIGFLASKSASAGAPSPSRPVLVASAAPGGPPPALPAYPVFLTADAPLMERVVQVAQLAMMKQAEGVTGFQFSSWMVGFYPGGLEIYEFLEARGGRVGCMGLLAMVPQFAAQLQDAARVAALEAWFDDFFSFDPAVLGEEESAAVEETAGAPA